MQQDKICILSPTVRKFLLSVLLLAEICYTDLHVIPIINGTLPSHFFYCSVFQTAFCRTMGFHKCLSGVLQNIDENFGTLCVYFYKRSLIMPYLFECKTFVWGHPKFTYEVPKWIALKWTVLSQTEACFAKS